MAVVAGWLAELSRVSTQRWADALEAHHAQRLRSRALRGLPEHPASPAPLVERVPRVERTGRDRYTLLRRWAGWYEQLARLYGNVVELTLRGAHEGDTSAASGEDEGGSGAPRGGSHLDAEVVRLLRRIELLLLKYPVAAQAAYSALVAEGRAFALTEEGARYDAALRASRAFERHWLILEKLTARLMIESEHAVLPTSYLDAVVQGARVGDLRLLMGRLFGGGKSGLGE